eukprot:SAG11_NODE_28091_length_325_cov_1.588496_1_plen_39_part_10
MGCDQSRGSYSPDQADQGRKRKAHIFSASEDLYNFANKF